MVLVHQAGRDRLGREVRAVDGEVVISLGLQLAHRVLRIKADNALRGPLPAWTLALTRHFICTIGTSSEPQPPQMTPVRSTNGSTPTSPRQASVVATTTAAGTLAMGPIVGALAPRLAIQVAGLVVAATVASSAAAYAAHLFKARAADDG